MPELFGGVGRPSVPESEARTREFVRLVAEGHVALDDAARLARVKPERALRLLGDPLLWQVFVASRRDVPVTA